MIVYVDTSAFLAVLDADDTFHDQARQAWLDLIEGDHTLVCNNYVLVESFALLQRCLGTEAVGVFYNDILPVVQIMWVDEEIHRVAVGSLLTAGRKRLSLVDCASFETMRLFSVQNAFTFDQHFSEQGFLVIPK